mgnify:CR=1 FL=1
MFSKLFLKYKLDKCIVLDLFSGTGILGFESISRGASAVTFVEKDAKSIRLLYQNKNYIFIDF